MPKTNHIERTYVCFSLSSALQALQEGLFTIEQVYAIISRTKAQNIEELCEAHKYYPIMEQVAEKIWERMVQPRLFDTTGNMHEVGKYEFLCLQDKEFYDIWRLREEIRNAYEAKETTRGVPNMTFQEITKFLENDTNPIGSRNEAFEMLGNVLKPLLEEIQMSYVIVHGNSRHASIACRVIGVSESAYFFEYGICDGQYPVFVRVTHEDKAVSVRSEKEKTWQEPTLETLCRLSGCSYNPNWELARDAQIKAFEEAQQKASRLQDEK